MKKNTFPIFLTLLLGFITIGTLAQSGYQKFDPTITYSSLDKESRLASVFNLLAANDNKNVNHLRLQFGFDMRFSFSKNPDSQIILHYSGYNQRISGDIFFRDFNVDSLLLPQKIAAIFSIYQNNRLIDTLHRTISLNGGQILLPLSINTSPSVLSADIKIVRVLYTPESYHRFLQTAGLINHYYGYMELMHAMPQLLWETSDVHPQASLFFLNYVALSRLKNYVMSHDLSQKLHLQQRDPLNFEKAFKAMVRRQIRMQTLSQQLLTENSPAGIKDKEDFVRGYVALSIKAVNLSKEQQPYVAGSFNEFARIFHGRHETEFIDQIARYYDQNITSGQATVPQEIYKYFIDAASLKIRQQSFVCALDFLANAAYFENNFPEIKRIPEFDSCLIHARDGLASSYLKVALMASEKNDFQLEKRYLNKASQSLKTYHSKIKPPQGMVCYSQYAREMLRMAETSLKQGHYHETLSLLDTAYLACPGLSGIDTLRMMTCDKLLKHRLDVSQLLLEQNNMLASHDTLMQLVKDYPGVCSSHAVLTKSNNVTATATAVFQQVVLRAAQLHAQNRNIQAITFLNAASQLEKTFHLPGSPQLEKLITETTVPYILSVAEQANLEIWKKHLQKADSIYRLVQSLSQHYGVAENQEIKNTLNTLSAKIKVAGCQWNQEKISRLFTLAKRALKAYQTDAAKSYFLKAKQLYANSGSCHWDKKQTDSTFHSFETLFRFTDAYHELTLQLFSKGFAAVLPEFAKLEQQYYAGHLEKFGLPFTGLYPFVQSQHSEKLTLEAVHYFIQNKEFSEALRYLELSGNPGKAKAEQKKIAEGFAGQNLLPRQDILKDPAWSVFTKAYRKALLSKAK